MLKFSFATGCVLRTELWNQHLGFTDYLILSYQNVYLLANQHMPVFSGTDCTLTEAKPALNSNTPKG